MIIRKFQILAVNFAYWVLDRWEYPEDSDARFEGYGGYKFTGARKDLADQISLICPNETPFYKANTKAALEARLAEPIIPIETPFYTAVRDGSIRSEWQVDKLD